MLRDGVLAVVIGDGCSWCRGVQGVGVGVVAARAAGAPPRVMSARARREREPEKRGFSTEYSTSFSGGRDV